MSSISSQAYHADQTFRGESLDGLQIDSTEFHECTFVDCSFVEAIFHSCRFVNCAFRSSDLSLLQVPGSVFSGVRIEGLKLIGVDWTQADWGATRLRKPIAFLKCALNHSTFIGLTLSGMQMKECTAADVDFREADLSKADFRGTDLAESLFSNTDLTSADLRGARNYHIIPGQNMLTKTRFSMPEAMSLLYNLDIDLTEEGD